MPQTCTVCRHPQRVAIDQELVRGLPFRHIAERFGTTATGLFRHRAAHIPAALPGPGRPRRNRSERTPRQRSAGSKGEMDCLLGEAESVMRR